MNIHIFTHKTYKDIKIILSSEAKVSKTCGTVGFYSGYSRCDRNTLIYHRTRVWLHTVKTSGDMNF